MVKTFIINADDMGLTPGVTRGILRAYNEGVLTSASVMINCMVSSVGTLPVNQIKRMGLGLHLTLTAGAPLTPASEIPTLVDALGHFHKRDDFIANLEQVSLEDVRKEWACQISTFTHLFGTPDHIDSHHHIHLLPRFFPIALDFAHQLKIPIRFLNFVEGVEGIGYTSDMSGMGDLLDQSMLEQDRKALKKAGVRTADFFLENIFYQYLGVPEILGKILDNLPDGTIEVMVHPGEVDTDLMEKSSYVNERDDELFSLTHHAVKELLFKKNIGLTTFSELE
jgi:predicted glycoside hydrolase/deacetylase ChbG (UPF0249 family)